MENPLEVGPDIILKVQKDINILCNYNESNLTTQSARILNSNGDEIRNVVDRL